MLLRSEAEGPLSCSWILQPGGSDNGFQEVMLLFTEFLLTCLDSLALYSCEDTICAITSEATMYRGSAVPPLFSSTTPVMLVILTTHQGAWESSAGFAALYACTPRVSSGLQADV